MSSQEELSEEITEEIPEIESLFPPGGFVGSTPVRCQGCDLRADTRVDRAGSLGHEVLARCPTCQGPMVWDPSRSRFSFKMPLRGFSSTKQGMRRANSFIREGEKLQKTQWDNVAPMSVPEGIRPRNPTPGGPLDPKGPFAKRDPHRTIVSGINKDS